MMSTGTRVARFVRSVVCLAILVVAIPWALLAAARARFGGASPLHGVPAPSEWGLGRIRDAFTDRLTEATIADLVIRLALVVAWIAVSVVVVTVVAEVVHMVRHDGLPLPDLRGLGGPQSVARVIAVGLLVVVPMFSTAGRALARDAASSVPAAATDDLAPPEQRWMPTSWPEEGASFDPPATGSDAVAPEQVGPITYVVRPGDSVYAIAARIAGPDPSSIAEFADRLTELNLGRTMPDGERFTNAAFLDVGWVLELPPAADVDPVVDGNPVADDEFHVVEPGETLWSIAEDELGAGDRWTEIYDANDERTFPDGRRLDDPDLIHPGWSLDLPDDRPLDEPVPSEPVPADEVPAGDDSETSDLAVPVDGTAADEPERSDEVGHDANLDDGAGGEPSRPGTDDEPSVRPVNVWSDSVTASSPTDPIDARGPASIGPSGPASPEQIGLDAHDSADDDVRLLTLGRASMLAVGVLALVAARRRERLRRSRPRSRIAPPSPVATSTERMLRSVDPADRFLRVDLAVRAVARAAVAAGARVLAVLVSDDGDIELTTSEPVALEGPWLPTANPCCWSLPAATPIELLATEARRVGAPCPTIVQLGRTLDERDVYVDLEALEAIEVGGPGHHADAVVAAIAVTLAGSVLAEVTTLVGVGVPDEAFLGHRHHRPVADGRRAFECAKDAIGSTAEQQRSTFELRALGTGGETWEPAVVFIGSAAGTISMPADRTGIAVVSASPLHGPSGRLAPDGDAWILRPLGIRLVPVGLSPDDLWSVAALVASADAEAVPADGPVLDLGAPRRPGMADDDRTLAPLPDDPTGSPGSAPEPSTPTTAVVVRLLGPVAVESSDGRRAQFERSKSRELIAWLATHRSRSTRTAARTALWELDVRDATFANVVSEARRTLARLVEPPSGEEWIARTLTDELPLHALVRTDAELVDAALSTARLQPPDLAIATLRPAVELVVGPPFEGTTYTWSDAEGIASQYVVLATTVTAELAAHCLSIGDVEGVFAATGRGLQVLPGHEELIGLRMRAHAQAGDLAGVRREWEQYERVIVADPWSDGEPAEQLVELRRELLAR